MSFWLPSSECGAPCLAGTPVVSRARRLGRLLALAGVVAAGGAVLPLLPVRRRAAGLRAVAGAALRAMGIRLERRGRLPRRRALVVANHVSWLDILVLLAAGDLTLVAKVEVRDWPVIGRVAASTGTVFIDRLRPKSLRHTVSAVRDRLAEGAVMAAFPEGTTSCGQAIGPFRPAMFQAAIEAGVPVVPVNLRFTTAPDGQPATAAAFIGAETLVSSLGRVLAARDLRVRVHAGSAIHADAAATRRALARLAADAVRAEWPVRTPTAAPATPVAPPVAVARVPHLTLLDGGSAADDHFTPSGSGSTIGLSPAA